MGRGSRARPGADPAPGVGLRSHSSPGHDAPSGHRFPSENRRNDAFIYLFNYSVHRPAFHRRPGRSAKPSPTGARPGGRTGVAGPLHPDCSPNSGRDSAPRRGDRTLRRTKVSG